MMTPKRKPGTAHPTGAASDPRAKRERGATMARIEEVPHLRSLFRQYKLFHNDAKVIWLVTQLRDKAREQLEPVKKETPRPMSDFERAIYQDEGINTEWNLNDYDDAKTFGLLASTRDTSMSASQKSAAALLSHCSEALKLNAVPDYLRDWILDAFAGLDLDAVETGKKFSRGKPAGAIGPMRALVRKMLKKMSDADLSARGHFARDLWNTCKALPERKRCGIEFYDDHAFIPDHPNVMFDSFANIVVKEKKNEKEGRAL